jgi:carbon-monoxide dehydrogenase large subunit
MGRNDPVGQPVKPGQRVIGQRARRVEDPALLRGQGVYLDDVVCPGTLHAAFARSPYAHARILKLPVETLRAMPGVVAVFAAADLASEMSSVLMPPQFPSNTLPPGAGSYVLAPKEVCYVGEPVLMVVAESRALAEDAIAAAEVDYEPLAPVADAATAGDPDGPRVREGIASNLLTRFKVGYGAVSEAFASAPHVYRERFWQHRGVAHPMEGRGVLARPEPGSRKLTVWSSTQMSNLLHSMLIDVLQADEDDIRVVAPAVGGGFGCKYLVYPEELAVPAVARRLGRPVKWVEDRREHFMSAIQERDQYWDVEIACDANARVLAIRGGLIHDQGAYTPQGFHCSYNSASSLTGPYVVPAYEIDVQVMQTNKVPVQPVRGAGYPQAAFVMERLIDLIAREHKLDRAEVRSRNLIPPDKMPYPKKLKNRSGAELVIDGGDYPKCQALGLERIGYADFPARQEAARRQGRYLGIGFAHAVKPTGRGPFEMARVRVSTSGRVTVYAGAMEMGQGIKTSLAQVCAEQLGVALEAVEVTAGDSAYIPAGFGGFGSRQAIFSASAVHVASVAVRDKALKAAANLLEAAEQDLELKNGRVEVKGVPGHGISLGDLSRKLRGAPGYALPGGVTPTLEGEASFQLDMQAFANAFHVCEVEVDVGTGDVRILRYVAVQDSGRLINPLIAEGQVHGGIVHGIGNALFEWMRYDAEAQPITTTFADYLLPTATEIPNIEVLFVETPSTINPLGVKGIGEAATISVAPAIIAAVENALTPFGVCINEVPLTPVRVLELIGKGVNRAGVAT